MILITGATGFLGRHLVPLLIQHGYALKALVRPTSDTRFLEKSGVLLAVVEDISSRDAVAKACEGCEAVIHAAGEFRFWGSYEAFYNTNVRGTQAVVHGCQKAGVKRLIYVSTIAVAGSFPAGTIIDEAHPPNPQEEYQVTKLEAESVAFNGRSPNLEVITIRPGAFYGPWGSYAFNRLFFEEPLRGWRIKVAGGKHIQFPVYVPDVAQGVLLALQKGQDGEIYNICGESMTHNTCNNIVSDLAGISRFRIPIPKSAVLALAWSWTQLSKLTHREPFYPINLRLYVFQDWNVSIEKAKRELGFKPTPFKEGAAETLKWFSKNRNL